MGLVDYSDSEDSGDEKPQTPPKQATIPAKTNFAVDRSNPQKIRVKLADAIPTNGTHEDEPAPKRAKLGGFSGFNAMLPPPKRDAESQKSTSNAPARKVFSLKTSSEAGFSRESDAEMRKFFADQDVATGDTAEDVGLPDVPKKAPASETTTTKGNTFMFKPLSVARGNKKKKPASLMAKPPPPDQETIAEPSKAPTPVAPPPKKKVSLFSAHQEADLEPAVPEPEPEDDDGVPSAYPGPEDGQSYQAAPASTAAGNQSLDTIASDLNLSAAARRQLFGRSGKDFSASSVVNFNTDQEYAANEAMRATGEQVQHNPVRAIAPGKHSLRQLVTAAQGQKDALEESFAAGKRNRKEAGSKYGW